MNDWALITGASAGIGLELARLFAADGCHLALVARNEDRLKQLAEELAATHHNQVKVVPQDLSQPGAAARVFAALREVPVSVLVNNAGFGSYGPFAQAETAAQTALLQVNIVALVELTRLFVKPMLERGRGRILQVASTAAFQPGPNVNCYYASKAFVYSFSYALAVELQGTGVTVTALCPGTTRTEFFQRAGMRMRESWPMMDARIVAQAGYRGMLKGRRVVIPGLMNQVLSFFAKRLPPCATTAFVRKLHAGANSAEAG